MQQTSTDAVTHGPAPHERMLRYFSFAHLPAFLQPVSARFAYLAEKLTEELPASAERTVALRKLLEAKDAAVRARVFDTDVGRA